jgi:hypothetical protein
MHSSLSCVRNPLFVPDSGFVSSLVFVPGPIIATRILSLADLRELDCSYRTHVHLGSVYFKSLNLRSCSHHGFCILFFFYKDTF